MGSVKGMPVWGRNRSARWGPKNNRLSFDRARARGKVVIDDPSNPNKKRIIRPKKKQKWEVFHSRLATAEAQLSFPIQQWLTRRVEQTRAPATVLDWGCGAGETINELARKTPGIMTYGYDHKHYRSWTRNPRVAFIQESPYRMLRFIKNRSMDLIYSNFGLIHFLTTLDTPKMVDYIESLSQKLKTEGVMVMHYPSMNRIENQFFKKMIRERLREMTVETGAHEPPGRPTIVIRRKSSS